MIPPCPSGEYSAEGLLITSTLSMRSAGMVARTAPPCGPLNTCEGWPSIMIWTGAPRRVRLPFRSTWAPGMLRRASAIEPEEPTRSVATL